MSGINFRVQTVNDERRLSEANQVEDYASLEGDNETLTRGELTALLQDQKIEDGRDELVDLLFDRFSEDGETVSANDVAQILDQDNDGIVEYFETKILAEAADEDRFVRFTRDANGERHAFIPTIEIETDDGTEISLHHNQGTRRILNQLLGGDVSRLREIFKAAENGNLNVDPGNTTISGMLFALEAVGVDRETLGDIYDIFKNGDVEDIKDLEEDIIDIFIANFNGTNRLDNYENIAEDIADAVDEINGENIELEKGSTTQETETDKPGILVNGDDELLIEVDEFFDPLDRDNVFNPPATGASGYRRADGDITRKGIDAFIGRLEDVLGDDHPIIDVLEGPGSYFLKTSIMREINNADNPTDQLIKFIEGLTNTEMDTSDDSVARGEDGGLSTLGVIEASARLAESDNEYELEDIAAMSPEEVNEILEEEELNEPVLKIIGTHEYLPGVREQKEREEAIDNIVDDAVAQETLTTDEWEDLIRMNMRNVEYFNFEQTEKALSDADGNVDVQELKTLFTRLGFNTDSVAFDRLIKDVQTEAAVTGRPQYEVLMETLNVIGDKPVISTIEIEDVLQDYTVRSRDRSKTGDEIKDIFVEDEETPEIEGEKFNSTLDLDNDDIESIVADENGNIEFQGLLTVLRALGVDQAKEGNGDNEATRALFDEIRRLSRRSGQSELTILKVLGNDTGRDIGELKIANNVGLYSGHISEHSLERAIDDLMKD